MKARWLRDHSLVLGLALAPWGWVVANICYAIATRSGGRDGDGAAALALYGANPGLVRIAVTAVTISAILVIPAILGFYRLAGERMGVVIGGGLMAAGYICYAVINGQTRLELAMAERGGASAGEYAAAIDAGYSDMSGVWVFLLFVLGNIVGTAVLAISLWRAGAAPMWVPLGLLSWPVLHILGLAVFHSEVAEVVGAVFQAAAFGMCALLVAQGRTRSDAVTHARSSGPATEPASA